MSTEQSTYSYGWQWAYHSLKSRKTLAEVEEQLEGSLFCLGEDFRRGALAGVADWKEEAEQLRRINEIVADMGSSEREEP